MSALDDLQQLTSSQGVLLYRLVDLGYLTRAQVDQLINRLVRDRIAKATDYLTFAQQLDATLPLHQPHIISRCYYVMYHAARALVLHVRRSDLDHHGRLSATLGKELGITYGELLTQWREKRNHIDYSPYPPADLANQAVTAVSDAISFLTVCRDYLQNRGVTL